MAQPVSFMDHTTQSSPISEDTQTMAPTNETRGRGKNKCYWEHKETQLLIEALQEMACDPSWETDGGFRRNYLCVVHRRILVKMPTFSKLVTPHIESKVKWLKAKFHVINDMLKYSGCQWNDVEKKVACEKDWHDAYCKVLATLYIFMHHLSRGRYRFLLYVVNIVNVVLLTLIKKQKECRILNSLTLTSLSWCMEKIELRVGLLKDLVMQFTTWKLNEMLKREVRMLVNTLFC